MVSMFPKGTVHISLPIPRLAAAGIVSPAAITGSHTESSPTEFNEESAIASTWVWD